jgi:hypothetical protein
MWTLIQTVQSFPELKSFIVKKLLLLIQQKIWTQQEILWEGFIHCCAVYTSKLANFSGFHSCNIDTSGSTAARVDFKGPQAY